MPRKGGIYVVCATACGGGYAFEFIVVEFVTDTSLLTTREQVHLDWLFSLSADFRYNLCPTGSSWLGMIHTAEAKAAISAAQSGVNNSFFGQTHTAEAKAAISAAQSGVNNGFFGHTHTAEAKAAISAAQSGVNNSFFGQTHTASSIEQNILNQPNRMPVYV